MTPHNYVRQAIPYIKEVIHKLDVTPEYLSKSLLLMDEIQKAVKFVLPDNGVIFDNKLQGLPDILKLPYNEVVLEYCCTNEDGRATQHFGKENTVTVRKRIVYAQQEGDNIQVLAVVFTESKDGNYWQVLPYIAEIMPRNNVCSKDIVNNENDIPNSWEVEKVVGTYYDLGGLAKKIHGDRWEEHAYYNMGDECQAVLGLLEALSCSNVKPAKLSNRQKMNKNAARRGALPFDEYHVLTIDGPSNSSGDGKSFLDRRSPREHLRRGHIRRLENKKIWINSMVINAGSHGKIQKSYALEAA